MEAALVIAFREGMEAFLVLGIILAFLDKSDLHNFKRYAWAGFVAGIIISVILAVIFTVVVDGFESEDLQYNISLAVLAFAIVLLTYMVFWMQHNSRLTNMKKKIELSRNQKLVTFLIVFTAIFREGLETVLFTLALTMEGENSSIEILTGLGVGFFISGFLIWVLFHGSIKLSLEAFFKVSSYLILFIVAGLVSLFVKGMQAYEYLPTFITPLYDSSFIVTNDSMPGRFLGVLVGYDAMPSLLQVLAWVAYVILIITFLRRRT